MGLENVEYECELCGGINEEDLYAGLAQGGPPERVQTKCREGCESTQYHTLVDERFAEA